MPYSCCFPCLKFHNEEIVKQMDYSNTNLSEIFPEVWEHERNLEALLLASSRIHNLPPQLFYCQSLRVLNISNNHLNFMPDAVGSLRHLQHLNLSRNLLTNIPESIKNCKNLVHLDLSCNNLQRLPAVVTSLIALQELFLNETNLEFLPANFGRLINLRILELRLNNLITLPKSICRLGNLQRIDIGGNEFIELPEVVGELKQLRELWIDFNQIRHISPNVAKLKELVHFEANNNLLDSLPNEIRNWRNIEVLSICTNNLLNLPFSVGMMKSLVTFKCESNELQKLPDSICQLESLEELVLSHNHLESLPSTVGMLRNLKFLFVDGNELRSLPVEICNCININILSMSHNKILDLPQSIGNLSNLRVLNVVNNRLSSLPASILRLVNLTSLWINDNQSQPLVSMQYLDPIGKTELTCFMLPQQRANSSQPSINAAENENRYLEIPQQQYHQEVYSSATSPSKRICFAEDISSSNQVEILPTHHDQHNTHLPSNKSVHIVHNDSKLGTRLLRSPTPYPKELRVMAKYVRNNAEQKTSTAAATSELLNVKEARIVMNNTNLKNRNCDTNFVQYASTQQQQLHHITRDNSLQNRSVDYYQKDQQRRSQIDTTSQNGQIYHSQMEVNEPVDNAVASNKVQNTQLPMCPPPYHIAKVLTKKSPEDLTQFETLRKEKLTDPFSNGYLAEVHKHQQLQQPRQFESDQFVLLQLNNSCSGNVTYNVNSSIDLPASILDHQNNLIDTINKEYPLGEQRQAQQHMQYDNSSFPQADIRKNAENTNPKKIEQSNRTWLFGVHKNPTVKQVTLKYDEITAPGFEVGHSYSENGVFITQILPDSPAARLLCLNDKLLEVDGHDFTNLNLTDAQRILLNLKTPVNIMLSRK